MIEFQIIGLVAAFMIWKIAELVITKLLAKKNGNGSKLYLQKVDQLLEEFKQLRQDEKEVHKELGNAIIAEIKETKRVMHEAKDILSINTKTINDTWDKLK
jgi:hypothetical protein